MEDREPTCNIGDHEKPNPVHSEMELERAAGLFRAMGDAPRLQILEYLKGGERCVTEIVEAVHDKFSTVSQRLRVLRTEGLVTRRREGTHLYYGLADQHVVDLLQNALAHATELEQKPGSPGKRKENYDE